MWGALFGAAGSIIGGAMQANAIEDATNAQIKALERQREWVFQQLDPKKIGAKARAADVARAKARLELQGVIDPMLLQQRYDAQKAISDRLAGLTGDASDQVAAVAAQEAIRGVPGLDDIKARLIDSAMSELNAGATLPPDVQAELMQAGLERTGQMSGSATAGGPGGNILRELIGTAALKLKSDRQTRATQLAQAAQDMDAKRQAILGSLFPSLAAQSLSKLGATQGILTQSNAMRPESGLGGSDIANLWLARVGATNKLDQRIADIGASGTMGAAEQWGRAIGGAGSAAGSLLNILMQPSNRMSDEEYYFRNPA